VAALLIVLLLHCSNALAMGEPVLTAAATAATPTTAPHDGGNATSAAPTKAPIPSNTTTHTPTAAPNRGNATAAPTKAITKAPTPGNNTKTPAPHSATASPIVAPTSAAPVAPSPSKSPAKPPPHDDDGKKKNDDGSKQHRGFSIWRMLGKTLAFLILLFLSVLAFGAIMNHRYRIYYFLKGLWYTIMGLECTRWMLAKLGLRHRVDTSEMNTVIFDDNEMSYGLLMQENE
jgi:hypothetical protein